MSKDFHQSLIIFLNFVGILNLKLNKSFQVSTSTALKNFLLVPAYVAIRYLVQVKVHAFAINKIFFTSSSFSTFFKTFSKIAIVIFQFLGFTFIYVQLWNRKRVSNFMLKCFAYKNFINSQEMKILKTNLIRSTVSFALLSVPYYFVYFYYVICFNWQGIVYLIATRASDVIVFTLILYLRFVLLFLTLLLKKIFKNLHQCLEHGENLIHEYRRTSELIQDFNQTFGFVMTISVSLISVVIVTQESFTTNHLYLCSSTYQQSTLLY